MPLAKPLAGAHGAFRFPGTPVENQCSTHSLLLTYCACFISFLLLLLTVSFCSVISLHQTAELSILRCSMFYFIVSSCWWLVL